MRFSAKNGEKGGRSRSSFPAFPAGCLDVFHESDPVGKPGKGVMPGQPFVLPELAPEHFHRNSVEQADQGKQPCPVEPVQQKLGLAGGCFDRHEGTEDNPAGQAGKNAPRAPKTNPARRMGMYMEWV